MSSKFWNVVVGEYMPLYEASDGVEPEAFPNRFE